MADQSRDLLLQLSTALAAATASAQSSVVAIRTTQSPALSGTLWRRDLVVASEQVFPKADEVVPLRPQPRNSELRQTQWRTSPTEPAHPRAGRGSATRRQDRRGR